MKMRFLAHQTSIPIPFILHSGTKKGSPLELGPYIMMDYIQKKRMCTTASTHRDVQKRNVEFSTKTSFRCSASAFDSLFALDRTSQPD